MGERVTLLPGTRSRPRVDEDPGQCSELWGVGSGVEVGGDHDRRYTVEGRVARCCGDGGGLGEADVAGVALPDRDGGGDVQRPRGVRNVAMSSDVGSPGRSMGNS
jgi:hypothetical protein